MINCNENESDNEETDPINKKQIDPIHRRRDKYAKYSMSR